MDSDDFLWRPDSPVNRAPDGTPRFLGGAMLSAEAGEIVAETLRARPLEVAQAMLGNALRQLVLAGAGDTLAADHLEAAVRPRIAEAFPPRELAAYDAALQPRGALPAAAAPFLWPHGPVLLGGAALALFAWWRAARERDLRRLGLVVGVLVGVSANAVATGALSKPHLRYEARILWLMPVVAALALAPRRR
jgi:heme A synthase